MFYEDIEDHSPEHFHRATGVSKTLFSEMLSTLEAAKPRMGRPPKLSLANQLVVCLMYLREYCTQFHSLGQNGTSVLAQLQHLPGWAA